MSNQKSSSVASTQSILALFKRAQSTFDPNGCDATLLSCGYTLGDVIGEGSYATVHRAHSLALDKAVAIKIVVKKGAPKRFLDHFLPREIDIIKRLRHPNILRYHQCIETNHRYLISMEYAANGCILDLLLLRKQFSERLGRKFFRELVDALKYLHSYDIVHRDLKLENLMLTDEFQVKLGDFGFSRRVNEARTAATKYNAKMPLLSDTFCGSHAYASPEILNFEPYDPKLSDIWACGVILYTMVSGCFPFDDSCLSKLLEQAKKPLTFLETPLLTIECKDLLRQMIAPIDRRIGLNGIGKHEWMSVSSNDGLHVLHEVQTDSNGRECSNKSLFKQ